MSDHFKTLTNGIAGFFNDSEEPAETGCKTCGQPLPPKAAGADKAWNQKDKKDFVKGASESGDPIVNWAKEKLSK